MVNHHHQRHLKIRITFLSCSAGGFPYRGSTENKKISDVADDVGDGIRQSTAEHLAKPQNLQILRNTTVTVTMDVATIGVEALIGRRQVRVQANEEVILSAGAINSPQLLMLSGIGNAEHLRDVGIAPIVDAVGVGQNLMDHLEVYVQQACTEPLSLYKDLGLWVEQNWSSWLYNQTGLGATNHFEVYGFMRSDSSQPYPNIHFSAGSDVL